MQRKKTLLILLLSGLTCSLSALDKVGKKQWKLVWSDEFKKREIDESKWRYPTRGKPDWCKYQSKDPRCFEIKKGMLYLRGIVNDDFEKDSMPYLTGGLISKDRYQFKHGKIEIRAKLGCATGAWPALWLLGASNNWPFNGEVDIMEHLNHDTLIYQTVHSEYTQNRGGGKNPPQGGTAAFNKEAFNLFSVELYADKVVFLINDKVTFEYPKVEPTPEGQWPFDNEMFILLTQQLEGSWVGKAKPEELPVEMIIDYVRVYMPRK